MNKLLIAGVILALGLGVWGVSKDKTVYVDKNTGQNLGALTGPDIPYRYLAVNRVRSEFDHIDFTGATSTPCSFVSPASTSTLRFTNATIGTATSSATSWVLATSTSPNATTTGSGTGRLAGDFSVATGAKANMVYTGTTTATVGFNDGYDVLPPLTYVTWGFEGGSGFGSSATSIAGTCNIEYLVN